MNHQQAYALLICTGPGVGGTERAALGLARGLQSQSVQVQTIFPYVEGEMGALFLAEDMGVQIDRNTAVRSFSAHRTPHDLLALRRLVRSTKAQVVNIHFGNNRISIWDTLAIRMAGARWCVATVQHAIPLRDSRERQLTQLASTLCARVVVSTPALAAILIDVGVSRQKIIEIPLGVKPPTVTIDRIQARGQLGLPHDALVVGALGRLVSSKGFDDLIIAISLLSQSQQPVHLVIGGEGPLHEELELLARKLLGDQVHILGRVANLDVFYAAIDVFALASHEEGFGLVFIEAGFQGVPSVAAAVGGVPYVISHNQTGLLVPDKEPHALAAAIGQLLASTELRQQMGAAARKRSFEKFSEQTMAERYRKVLFPS